MKLTNTRRKISSVLFVLLLLFNLAVLAEEIEADVTQTESLVVTSPPQQPESTATSVREAEKTSVQQTPSPPEDTASPATPNQEEGEQQTPLATGELDASPIEDVLGQTSDPLSTEGTSTPVPAQEEQKEVSILTTEDETEIIPTQTPHQEDVFAWISLEWEFSSEDGFLRTDESITLVAKITTEAEGLQMQWQIATKPASVLAESEAEWEDVSGANGEKYTFTVQEGMQSWRWRLCATLPNGEAVYSSEINLPMISVGGDELASGEEDDSFSASDTALPLPIAAITLTASIPLEEIAYGDEVTLVADIHNPREDMLLQWQYMPAEMEAAENAWESVEDANESSYTYVVSEENVEWIWRLLITVPEEITEPEDEISVAEYESASGEETDLEVPSERPASDARESKSPAQESTLDTTEPHPEESLAETVEIIGTTEE